MCQAHTWHTGLEKKMELVRFYALIIKIAIALAMMGELKACTLELVGKSAAKNGMMSYSRFTKALTSK